MQQHHERILYKFEIVDSIIKIAKTLLSIKIDFNIEDIRSNYLLKTMHLLCIEPGTPEYQTNSEEYFIIVNSENFTTCINEILTRIRKTIIEMSNPYTTGTKAYNAKSANKISNAIDRELNDTFAIINPEIDRLRSQVESAMELDTSIEMKKQKFGLCCGEKMIILAATSQLKCSSCGQIKKIWGVVFEDYQFYNHDGQKAKHGTYEPGRHYRMQLDCIQGKLNKEINSMDLNIIKGVIRGKGIMGIPSCHTLRGCLKECKLTKYNNFIPLIIRLIYGVIPHQLTFTEDERLTKRFNREMEVYESIKKIDEQNRRYYPYFIYKCIEAEFEDESGPRSLLVNIHLQSKETLASHDEIHEKICEITGTKYKPTIFEF